MRGDELDCHRVMFGFTITQRTKDKNGTDSPLLNLYLEDDEYWHHKVSFDKFWLSDLKAAIAQVEEMLGG